MEQQPRPPGGEHDAFPADNNQPPDEPEAPAAAELAGETPDGPDIDGEIPPLPPRIFITGLSADLAESDAVPGLWLDAAVETEELQQAVRPYLSHIDDGRLGYRIAKVSGFQGYEVAVGTSLGTVARVARGILEHGRAFVAYIEAWGNTQEAVDEFSRYFVGSYPSIAAWAEREVEAYGWWDSLGEHMPPALLPHLRIDYERLGRELSYDAHVVDDEEAGQVYVFRLHA